ncbi:MAG TPA: L,D-transpeptidase, partial [Chloroflexota bacterium]|nr:L,D-transpeptidase [Chloroflexota bacterium]
PRLSVYVVWTKNYAFVDARAVGPSGPPPVDWLATVTGVAPAVSANSNDWIGRVVSDGAVERKAPSNRSPARQTLPAGSLVQVTAWVMGDEEKWGNWTWARLADGGYAYSAVLQAVVPTSPPPIPASHPSGQWIDVNLLRQTAVAYQDSTPLHLASVSTGSPGWETSLGTHYIQRRVADETMNGMTLNRLVLDAWHSARVSYNLTHVLDTQYIDDLGDALHENYWLPVGQFGIPHSHGCVGMKLSDAQWFWNWATIGVPVVIRAS